VRVLEDDFAGRDVADIVVDAIGAERASAAGIRRGGQKIAEVAVEAHVFFVPAIREAEGIAVDVA
jgi:hypothetical protein